MLATAGFKDVNSMEGGIRAWEGNTATGAPETGMAFFPEQASTEELIALAWLLEDGNLAFYRSVSSFAQDTETIGLFQELGTAEQHHEEALVDLYGKLTGKKAGQDFPRSLLRPGTPEGIMEGGIPVTEATAWAKGKSAGEILELAMAMEVNSYDLYVKMERKAADGRSKEVFQLLAREEKEHLDRFAALFEKKMQVAVKK